MILYELRCADGHGFEAWFSNSDAYDQQSAASQVSCPVCGDCNVEKAPMAPRVARGNQPTQAEQMRTVLTKVAELNKHIADTCEYVGTEFPEEARKIHYGETEHREIYGEASTDEVEQLQEEGIAVRAIPWVRRKDS